MGKHTPRTACLTCGSEQERTVRANGSIAAAPLYCSDQCKPRCAIEGCDRPRRKRGWCANHYATWHTKGDPEAALTYTWAAERKCVVCGAGPDSPKWEGRFRKYCSRNCAQLFRHHDGDVPLAVPCGVCSEPIPLLVATAKRARRRSDIAFCDEHFRRARPTVTAADLATTTGAWCRLCGDPVDMALISPDRMSATVDHIVPRALGGSDDVSNLQLAHRGCNSSKRHRFVG